MRFLFVIPTYVPAVGGAQTFTRTMAQRLTAAGHRVTVLTTTARTPDDFWRPRPENPGPSALPAQTVLDGAHIIRLRLRYPRPAPYRFAFLRRAGHWLKRSRIPNSLQLPLLRHFARFMPPLVDLECTMNRLVAESDIVHGIDANWDGLFTLAGSVARKHGKPFVAVPLMHSGSEHILAHFTMAHQLRTYEHSSAIVALSTAECRRLIEFGMSAARVHVVPMGVNPEVIEQTKSLSEEAAAWYTTLGCQECAQKRGTPERGTPGATHEKQEVAQHPMVLFLGAATYDKGLFTLIRAVLELGQRGHSVHLACAGPQQERARQYIDSQPKTVRSRLRNQIHLLGVVDEQTKHALLSRATALALPSRVDSFGIVLLEAWLHRKPVVAAAEGGLVETVQPGENGLLVPFDDVRALATALERLVSEPSMAARLGESGYRRVFERYTWNHTYTALWQIYETIEHADAGPAPR